MPPAHDPSLATDHRLKALLKIAELEVAVGQGAFELLYQAAQLLVFHLQAA